MQTMKPVDGESESQTPVVIEPLKSWLSFDVRELWDYRELLYFFIWRDIKVRYKQTILGGLWVILQPLMPMIVFSVFFGLLIKVPSDNLPYPIFAYTALLPWHLFAYASYSSSESLVSNQGLITKVYFPRLFVPLSVLLGGPNRFPNFSSTSGWDDVLLWDRTNLDSPLRTTVSFTHPAHCPGDGVMVLRTPCAVS